MIMIRMEFYFPNFYNKHYKIITFALLGLSLPIILRGVINIVSTKNKKFSDWADENINTYNSLQYLFCDLFPLCL